jgi:D-xylose transport system substrate-binding protein
MGELIAKSAVTDTGLKGNWIIIGGDKGNGVADACVKGFHNIADPLISNGTMKLVAEYNEQGFDSTIARSQTEQALTKINNDLQGILGMWDDGAIGALAALKAQGLNGKVWVSGQDASEPACRGMVLREFNMSGFTEFGTMAQTAAQLAVQVAKGQTITANAQFDMGAGNVPFFPINIYPVTLANLVDQMKKYSAYDDPRHILFGIPQSQWPAGAAALLT